MDKMARSKSENRTARDAGWGKHNGQEADGTHKMAGNQEVHKQDGQEVGGKTGWQGRKRNITKMARTWVVKQDGRKERGT